MWCRRDLRLAVNGRSRSHGRTLHRTIVLHGENGDRGNEFVGNLLQRGCRLVDINCFASVHLSCRRAVSPPRSVNRAHFAYATYCTVHHIDARMVSMSTLLYAAATRVCARSVALPTNASQRNKSRHIVRYQRNKNEHMRITCSSCRRQQQPIIFSPKFTKNGMVRLGKMAGRACADCKPFSLHTIQAWLRVQRFFILSFSQVSCPDITPCERRTLISLSETELTWMFMDF